MIPAALSKVVWKDPGLSVISNYGTSVVSCLPSPSQTPFMIRTSWDTDTSGTLDKKIVMFVFEKKTHGFSLQHPGPRTQIWHLVLNRCHYFRLWSLQEVEPTQRNWVPGQVLDMYMGILSLATSYPTPTPGFLALHDGNSLHHMLLPLWCDPPAVTVRTLWNRDINEPLLLSLLVREWITRTQRQLNNSNLVRLHNHFSKEGPLRSHYPYCALRQGRTERLILPTQAQGAGHCAMGSTVDLHSYWEASVACSDTKQA